METTPPLVQHPHLQRAASRKVLEARQQDRHPSQRSLSNYSICLFDISKPPGIVAYPPPAPHPSFPPLGLIREIAQDFKTDLRFQTAAIGALQARQIRFPTSPPPPTPPPPPYTARRHTEVFNYCLCCGWVFGACRRRPRLTWWDCSRTPTSARSTPSA